MTLLVKGLCAEVIKQATKASIARRNVRKTR